MIILHINHKNNISEININNINEIKNIDLICTWKYNNNIIKCYNNISNKIENKHKLPSNGKYINNKNKLYDDIYIINYSNNNIINYSIGEYGELHYYFNEIYDKLLYNEKNIIEDLDYDNNIYLKI